MPTNNLDTKYSQLVDQLQALNNKLDQFINGGASATIVTGSGTIKSLAGIIEEMRTMRYAQKIIDHRLYDDMVADTSLADGDLVRVWGDSAAVVGLYKRQGGVFSKISYVDLYDLTRPA